MERSILLTKRNILWNMAILLRVNGNIVGGFALQFAAFGQVDKFVPKIKLCPFLLQISSKLLGVTTCNTTTLFLMIRISKLGFIPLFDFASLNVLKFLEKDTLLYILYVCLSSWMIQMLAKSHKCGLFN